MTNSNHFPQSETGQRFCKFFNHRYNFIKAKKSQSKSTKWKTYKKYPIEHRNLWSAYNNPSLFIGVSFNTTTRYALLDIDKNSPYHPDNNENALRDLLWAYEDVGINKSLTLQSSWSEGLHVYLILPKEFPTYKLAVMLKLTAIRSGFMVKDGILEIFPNTKSYGKKHKTAYKAHRLPLQEGSYLLDENFTPYSNDIKTFLDLAEVAAASQDIEIIEAAIELADKVKAFRYIKGDGKKAAEFRNDLKEQIAEGWTGFGQTNDLLRIIGTYGRVFKALGGKALADYIAETAESLQGYYKYCRHQHHIKRRASEWGRCVEKFYYPYGSKPNRVGTFAEMVENGSKENKVNKERQESAVSRIKAGINHLKETLTELPTKIGELKTALIDVIQKLFNVRPSDKTLRKYKDLWYPKHKETTTKESTVVENNTSKASNPIPVKESRVSPTPSENAEKNGHSVKAPKPVSAKQLNESAPPPSYMKVLVWAVNGVRLIYRGESVLGAVLLEGEKQTSIQEIQTNEEVSINYSSNSKFLLNSNDPNLQVSIKPIEQKTPWQNGIVVRAKDLFEYP